MGYYLRSIQDEYDDKGNYIGNSDEGNKWHGVGKSYRRVEVCAACGSHARTPCEGHSKCAHCGCCEAKHEYMRD